MDVFPMFLLGIGGRGCQHFFDCQSCMCSAGFYEFNFKFKEGNS